MRRTGDIANDNCERAALGATGRIDIAHRDWRIDRRAEAAAGDLANGIAGGVDDRRAPARRGAAVGADPEPLAGRFPCELPRYNRSAGETRFGSPPFSERPYQPGL